MDELTYDVLFAIIRESVSLFILLMFLFFSYRVVMRMIEEGGDKFNELVEAIRQISNKLD